MYRDIETLLQTESDSLHQTRDYKGFSPSIDWSNVAPEWDKAASIQVTTA